MVSLNPPIQMTDLKPEGQRVELGLDQGLGSASTLPCAHFQIPEWVVSGHLGLKARSEGLAWLGDGESVEQSCLWQEKYGWCHQVLQAYR